ncbi:MAG: FHA domain-containing protein [Pyrinomonadaceae bacterium]
MKQCTKCNKQLEAAQKFCDECGAKVDAALENSEVKPTDNGNAISSPNFQAAGVTSIGLPAVVLIEDSEMSSPSENGGDSDPSVHSILLIERGNAVSTEFPLTTEESNIGRWDADNGVFPDVDLDAFDPDSKISRKHARILHRSGAYFIEDLGSTNGTFINRGRRLLPGTPQVLNEGDEIIVGKTFLRFRIVR